MSFVGAIDQGTSSSRFMLFDKEGEVVSSHQLEHTQHHPYPGYVEHDAIEIWMRVEQCIQVAMAKASLCAGDLAAVGITNQRESALVWNKHTGMPYHRLVVWNDTRTSDICARIATDGGSAAENKDRFRATTGLPISPYFSATKLVWLLDNVSGLRADAISGEALFGTIDTWLVWKLTHGRRHVTDVTNASRTMLMDLRTLTWDPAICKELDIPMRMLPSIVPSSCVIDRCGPAAGASGAGAEAEAGGGTRNELSGGGNGAATGEGSTTAPSAPAEAGATEATEAAGAEAATATTATATIAGGRKRKKKNKAKANGKSANASSGSTTNTNTSSSASADTEGTITKSSTNDNANASANASSAAESAGGGLSGALADGTPPAHGAPFPLDGVPIGGILGDQQAALFGQNCTNIGDAKGTYGTGAFLLVNTGPRPVQSKNGLLTTVAYSIRTPGRQATGTGAGTGTGAEQGKGTAAGEAEDGVGSLEGADEVCYALEGSISYCGSLVQWLRDSLHLVQSAPETEKLARSVDNNGGVYFVPAFNGLYAPHWVDHARGVVCGLTAYVNKGHFVRAALEAAAYQTREVMDAMIADTVETLHDDNNSNNSNNNINNNNNNSNSKSDRASLAIANGLRVLRVDGGMTQNTLLMQFLADILDVPVVEAKSPDTTALGAAYAAGLAVGYWADVAEISKNWQAGLRHEPRMEAEERDQLLTSWAKAVHRSMHWTDDLEGRHHASPGAVPTRSIRSIGDLLRLQQENQQQQQQQQGQLKQQGRGLKSLGSDRRLVTFDLIDGMVDDSQYDDTDENDDENDGDDDNSTGSLGGALIGCSLSVLLKRAIFGLTLVSMGIVIGISIGPALMNAAAPPAGSVDAEIGTGAGGADSTGRATPSAPSSSSSSSLSSAAAGDAAGAAAVAATSSKAEGSAITTMATSAGEGQ